MSRIALTLALAVWPGLYASAQPRTAAANPPATPPSLVVLITVDQLRGDYLTRFSSQLSGGLARLARGGAWFTNAHHDHAITETAPGHATLLAGRFPRSLGIADNLAGVQDETAPILDAPGIPGASPVRFQGTTLVDWLRARDSSSRTLSVSMKDRGAILPVGRSRADVYWYLTDGRFTTSRYYRDSLPSWVKRFNARRLPQGYAGKSWTPLLPDSAYPETDSVSVESGGIEYTFPHRLPADSLAAADRIRLTPWMDEITLALALEGLRELGLGEGRRTDVLAVSLSATDIIGHAYGPDSKEIHDQVLRLDRMLGTFVDSLFRLRDSSRVAIVLTSDHGVGTIPELAARTVRPPPQRVNLSQPMANLRSRLAALGLDAGVVTIVYRTVKVDRAALSKTNVSIAAVLDTFAREISQVPGVVRVDRFRDLLDADTLTQATARRWSHQFPKADDVELVITLTPFSIFPGIPATHGSAYDYDTHVPLIFFGAAFRAGRYPNFIRTVDLAPTLARIVGVTPSEKLDGVVLEQAIR
jgi:predicted AlkP superfamily pyrophosphatase or phosphodiesterase